MEEMSHPLEIHWIVEGVSGSPEEGYSSGLASNRYRAILPAQGLTSFGHRVSLIDASRWRWNPTSRPDVIVVGKLLPSGSEVDFRALSRHVLSQATAALQAGVPVVADFNDDHFDHPVLGPHWSELALTASACTAGSETMADTVGRHTARPIHVVGDPIASPRGEPRVFRKPSGLSRIVGAGLSRRGAQRLKLVWYGNPGNWPAMQRWGDALAPLAEQQPLLLWIVTQSIPAIAAWVDQFNRRHAPAAITELAEWDEDAQWSMVRDADAVLIPSDPSDPRKVVKSSNRLVDALHAGRCVVASPLPAYRPYADFAELTDSPVPALRWLLDHPDDAFRKVVQGQAAVIGNAGLSAVAATWSDVLLRVVDNAESLAMSEQPSVKTTNQVQVRLALGVGDKDLQRQGAQIASRRVEDSSRSTGYEAEEKFPSLLDLHLRKTGKVSDKWEAYFPAYERLFESLRQRSVSLLEIGVQNGGSLEVWAEYFPNASHIIGCDIDKKCAELRYSDPRIRVVVGNANDPGIHNRLTQECEAFDIVIDDGSHLSNDIINSFLIYFPMVKSGGLYIIEDTHALYRNVPGGGILSNTSAQEFFKKCAELPNVEHWAAELQAQTLFSTFLPRREDFPGWFTHGGIESVEFRTSMIIVRRGSNPARLGRRMVVGEEASVFPGVLRHAAHRKVALAETPAAANDGVGAAPPASARSGVLASESGSLQSTAGRGLRAELVDRVPITPVRLNLGCGDKILPGYVNVDVVESRAGKRPDVICDLHRLEPFSDCSADEVMAIHVVEHFWRWEVEDILREWVRVLKPGGRMVLECPNLISACEEFLKNPERGSRATQEGQRTMWVFYGDPSWKDPYMIHRWGYTPASLGRLLQEVGLVRVRQEPAQYKLREPRDMRLVAEKPL